MHIQYAGTPGSYIRSRLVTRWQRTGFCGPRCKSKVLVSGEEKLYPGDYEPSTDERRRSLQCMLEQGRQMGSERRRRRRGESLRQIGRCNGVDEMG